MSGQRDTNSLQNTDRKRVTTMNQQRTSKETTYGDKDLLDKLAAENLHLRKAYEELIKTQHSKNEIFANISHDLRSPITTIKNAVEILMKQENFTKETALPLLLLMNQRIDLLEKMINDIFLLVTLDNQSIQMEFSSIPLYFFLEDYFYSCQADSKYQDRNLVLALPENLSGNIWADARHLTRVLENLFSNALKYSVSGDTIILGAYLEHDCFIVYVEDTGMGISPEDKDKIFERCYVSRKNKLSGVPSTGLGLSITKSILSYFQSDIWCDSTPDAGSRFSFRIPLSTK